MPMSDEGIGIRLLEALAARAGEFPGVDFEDLGTAGMRILHAIAGRQKAILVDCAFMGLEPGTIRKFNPGEVRSVRKMSGFSTHSGDLMAVLDLSRRLGEFPPEVVIFGIEPKRVGFGDTLAPELEKRFAEYLDMIARELTPVVWQEAN